MNIKNKARLRLVSIIFLIIVTAVISYPGKTHINWVDGALDKLKINLGLDLQGGVHLVYEADMSEVKKEDSGKALEGIQDVIENRVNAYGVSEPVVQTSKTGDNYRLIVELAGVQDIEEAKDIIKETPFLEFKKEGGETELSEEQKAQIEEVNKSTKEKAQEILSKIVEEGGDFTELAKEHSADTETKEQGGDLGYIKKGTIFSEEEQLEEAVFNSDFKTGEIFPELIKSSSGLHIIKKIDEKGEGEEKEVQVVHIFFSLMNADSVAAMMGPNFETTGLTGQYLEGAQVVFDPRTNMPQISLQFNDQGKDLFRDLTEENVGKRIAIYLDGQQVTAPVVQDVIRDGQAVINGEFTLDEAKETARRLNSGALPVPIKLISQQSIEASLGKSSLDQSLKAGFFGLLAVAIFMILYYRLVGLVAVVALVIYATLMVSIFKISSITPLAVTLTLSGIAGFILSIGMAVDANILIFERIKEELQNGRDLKSSLNEGFRRAWPSIRDGNYSTIITALVLMSFGSGFIKGFALILVIGVLMSMFSALVITRILLNIVFVNWLEKHKKLVIIGSEKKHKK
ncbi:MAG: protein translocase subunit SecD [Patescibacteria group bacterium]|jgi:protein-export membrane protein SecD|nr:protein translocase subunit SecD [Patescibacteria group bacterium]